MQLINTLLVFPLNILNYYILYYFSKNLPSNHKVCHKCHFRYVIMVSVKIMQGTQNFWVSFFYAKLGGVTMNKKNDNAKKSIWKANHIPLKDRKTSSGVTFWPKKVKGDKNAD